MSTPPPTLVVPFYARLLRFVVETPAGCLRRLPFAPFSGKRRFERWGARGRSAGRWTRRWSSTEEAGRGEAFRRIRRFRSCSRRAECEVAEGAWVRVVVFMN